MADETYSLSDVLMAVDIQRDEYEYWKDQYDDWPEDGRFRMEEVIFLTVMKHLTSVLDVYRAGTWARIADPDRIFNMRWFSDGKVACTNEDLLDVTRRKNWNMSFTIDVPQIMGVVKYRLTTRDALWCIFV